MEMKDLQYFVAVVDNGSFTKAAEKMYTSQPTLSKSIKKLEAELNVELLERSTRSLKLTDVGTIVYKQGLKMIGAMKELHVLLDEVRNLPIGEISFGVPPIVGTLFFPAIAKKFREAYPYVTLNLIEVGAHTIESLVEEGQVDVGIIVLPTDEMKFSASAFISEEFMIFTSEDDPIEPSTPIRLEQLAQEEFIIFTKEFKTHGIFIQACKEAGFIPNITYESTQWDLIVELVSKQLGVTMLPKSIHKLANHKKIKTIPLQTPPMWELAVITKKDSYQSFAVKALLHFLLEEYKAE